MDPKELRGLMEAYSEVYAPIEELYKGKHGQSETEYMDSRSDAGKQISGTSKLSGAAYSHRSYKGVGGPAKPGQRQQHQGKMTPADRNELAIRKANLKKEDVDIFDVVLEFLQAEGFAETLEEAEWLMANVIDEEAIGIILGEGHGSRRSFKTQSKDERWRVKAFGSNYTPHKNYDPKANRGQGQILRPNQAEKQRRKKLAKSAMGEEFELWVNALVEEGYDLSGYTWDEMYEFYLDEDAGIISGLAGLALGAKGASYAAKHTKRMRDYPKNFVKGIVDPRTYGSKKKKEQKEDYVNEAQVANRDPEKYEREQSKKYAPVRGEKTPMPPRGDKRREDFEKWYAANVR